MLIGMHIAVVNQLPPTEYTIALLSNHASVKQSYSTFANKNIFQRFKDNSDKIRYISFDRKWGLSEEQIERLVRGEKIHLNNKFFENINKAAGNKVRYLKSNGRLQKSKKDGLFWFIAHPDKFRLSSDKLGTLQIAQRSKSIKGSEEIVKTTSYQVGNLLAKSNPNSLVVFCFTFKGHVCQIVFDINNSVRYI